MIDVLNLEWMSYSARDRNMSSLVCNYLRYQGLNVVEESVFRGFEMIDKYKPKLVFMANGIGAIINYHLVKYASLKGIKVVTLISEGNFKDDLDFVDTFLWGWNKDLYLYEDSHMQWSERTRKLSLVKYPKFKDKIKVSGGCGFDIYKIRPTTNKLNFLKKYNLESYKKIIGVGCWDFTPFYPGNARSLYGIDETIKIRFQEDRDLFNKILINTIKTNPSVLFILKEHPGNILGYYMSGIQGAESLENVLILKNEPIIDIIAVCDIWLTYESTTVFEAWMLGKPTCLLNPSGIDFPRANTYKGSPNYADEKSLNDAIIRFYETDKLIHFDDDDITKERMNVITDTIQWDDGLNHVRAGNEILRVLEEKRNNITKSSVPYEIKIHRIKQKLINALKLKNSSIYQRSSSFSQEEVAKFSRDLYNDQISFYNSHGLSKENLQQILPL